MVRHRGARCPRSTARRVDVSSPSRPLPIRGIGAWASPQSEVIASRAVLVANAAQMAARHLLQPPRPPRWGGYRHLPDAWEFWQGRSRAPATACAIACGRQRLGARTARRREPPRYQPACGRTRFANVRRNFSTAGATTIASNPGRGGSRSSAGGSPRRGGIGGGRRSSVTIGRRCAAGGSSSSTWRAAASAPAPRSRCRTALPTSWPWRLSVVGSWMTKEDLEQFARADACQVERGRTTSAWPMSPTQTCS